jgi:hypothetical protein
MDALRLLLSTTVVAACLTTETSLAKTGPTTNKPAAQPETNKTAAKPSTNQKTRQAPPCEPNAIFNTRFERRYKPTQKKNETGRQQYVLSEYIAQRNVAAAGSVQLKSGEYAELDENNLLSTGSSESISSFEISEDGSVYIGYVRDPKTLTEVPAAPNLIVSAPALAQSLIFNPVEVLKVEEVALSPKDEEEALGTIRVESENAGEEVRICNGNIQTLLFTSRPDQSGRSDKSMQINIELEAQLK